MDIPPHIRKLMLQAGLTPDRLLQITKDLIQEICEENGYNHPPTFDQIKLYIWKADKQDTILRCMPLLGGCLELYGDRYTEEEKVQYTPLRNETQKKMKKIGLIDETEEEIQERNKEEGRPKAKLFLANLVKRESFHDIPTFGEVKFFVEGASTMKEKSEAMALCATAVLYNETSYSKEDLKTIDKMGADLYEVLSKDPAFKEAQIRFESEYF